MAVAHNPIIPEVPDGAFVHPVIKNVCAFPCGKVMTFDPRIKCPEWYLLSGIVNQHGRRQSQVAKKMRQHYHLVYECVSQTVPSYGKFSEKEGMTIDHIDGNRDNNAFSNLRLISKRDNVRSAHCKSGLPFAIRLRENGTYRVVLRVDGVMRHLGTFKDIDSAVAARDDFLKGDK